MVVQKCSVPWIFGSLDDYKFKKGFFAYIKNNPFIMHLNVFITAQKMLEIQLFLAVSWQSSMSSHTDHTVFANKSSKICFITLKLNQIAKERGQVHLLILNLKTIWSELKKPC